MLTLYFAPGSSSMAAHIALHEIGAPFDAKPLSFARKETRSPEFLALNPEGKVPTLPVDGRALTEIADIHLFRLYWRFFNSLHPAPGEFPNLHAHYQRMMARPAVRKTCEIEAAI